MIPAEMTGGWIREGISLDGAAPVEDAVVWWLQAPSKHCDLRVPVQGTDGLMSFAGTTTWTDPALTWTPDIELEPSIFEDVGVITWDGADMMEAGVFVDGDAEIGYVERWRRLPGSDDGLLALSSATGRLVCTGRYALTIIDERPSGGSFVAVAWTLRERRWTVDHSWPADATATTPPQQIAGGETTVLLDDGNTWTVDEWRPRMHSHP